MRSKPPKPWESYPLYAHATGQWAKKIAGKTIFFGAWADHAGALAKYLAERDAWAAGINPRGATASSLRDICNHYLAAREAERDQGAVTPWTFAMYLATCKTLCEVLGSSTPVDAIQPEGWARLRKSMAGRLSPAVLKREMRHVRMVFDWALRSHLIDEQPTYGAAFDLPTAKQLRLARSKAGPKLFDADDLTAILDACQPAMRAMAMLGINAAFGSTDVAQLEPGHIQSEWLAMPRPKTGMARLCWLWPETRDALAAVELPFRTREGFAYVRWDEAKSRHVDVIAQLWARARQRAGINKPGLGFYTLRRTFATIASEAKDLPAVAFVMGHVPAPGDMGAVYRQQVGEDRVQAVCEHVRQWLFRA